MPEIHRNRARHWIAVAGLSALVAGLGFKYATSSQPESAPEPNPRDSFVPALVPISESGTGRPGSPQIRQPRPSEAVAPQDASESGALPMAGGDDVVVGGWPDSDVPRDLQEWRRV